MAGNIPTVYIRSGTVLPGQVKDNGIFIGTTQQRRSRQSIENALTKLKYRHRTTQLREMWAVEAAIRRFRFPGGPYQRITKSRARLDSKIMRDTDFCAYIQDESIRFNVSNPTFQKTVFPVELDHEHRMRVSIEPWASQPSTTQDEPQTRSDAMDRVLQLVTDLSASMRDSGFDLQPHLSGSPTAPSGDDSERSDSIIRALEAMLQAQNIQQSKVASAYKEHEPRQDPMIFSNGGTVSSASQQPSDAELQQLCTKAFVSSMRELFSMNENSPEHLQAVVSSSCQPRNVDPVLAMTVLTDLQQPVNPPQAGILHMPHQRHSLPKMRIRCQICRWEHPIPKTVQKHEERCLRGQNQFKCRNHDKGCLFCSHTRYNARRHERNSCPKRRQPRRQLSDTLQE